MVSDFGRECVLLADGVREPEYDPAVSGASVAQVGEEVKFLSLDEQALAIFLSMRPHHNFNL